MTAETDLVPIERPRELRTRRDIAQKLAPIIQARYTLAIDGKRYVTVAGASFLASAMGYAVREVSARRIAISDTENAWETVCEVIDTNTGQQVGQAAGMCSDGESAWRKRPEFARRAMSSTRAAGRALKLSLGYLFVFLEVASCVAEEMPEADK